MIWQPFQEHATMSDHQEKLMKRYQKLQSALTCAEQVRACIAACLEACSNGDEVKTDHFSALAMHYMIQVDHHLKSASIKQ
jgi:hypothetical protein